MIFSVEDEWLKINHLVDDFQPCVDDLHLCRSASSPFDTCGRCGRDAVLFRTGPRGGADISV